MFVVVVVELKKAISHERWLYIHVCSSSGGAEEGYKHERWPDIHVCSSSGGAEEGYKP